MTKIEKLIFEISLDSFPDCKNFYLYGLIKNDEYVFIKSFSHLWKSYRPNFMSFLKREKHAYIESHANNLYTSYKSLIKNGYAEKTAISLMAETFWRSEI